MAGPWDKYRSGPPTQGGIVTKPADPTLPYKQVQERENAASAPYETIKAKNDAAASGTAPAKSEEELRAIRLRNQQLEQDLAQKPEDKAAVEQGKAAGFYNRARQANEAFEKISISDKPRSVIGGVIAEKSPTLSTLTSGAERQQADAYARAFINSLLRAESGATITPDEFNNAYRTYIPQPGEGPEAVEAKRILRQQAIEGIMLSAGPAAAGLPRVASSASNMSPQQVDQELQRLVRAGDREGAERLIAAHRLTVAPGDIDKAFGNSRAQVVRQPQQAPPDESIITNLKNSGMNILAGLGQGLTALPDMAAQGMGQLMAMPVDWAGYDQAANALRNTPQFGSAIERAVPTPQDWNGWGVRQAAKLEGGLLGFPAKAGNFLVDEIVGKVPARPPSISTAPTKSQVMDDAAALGIQPTAAAVGGPVSRAATATVAQTIGGARPIVAGAERMVDQGGRALSNIAGQEGRALNPEAMGQAATAGALKFRDASRDRIGQIYDKAAQIAGDVRVTPDRTVAELDRNIAQLAEVPGGADGASYLKGLRDEIANNFPDGVTIQGFRGMRTALRDRFFKDGLRGSDLERRVNGVVDMVSEDLTQSLISQGKAGAASLFKKADSDWRQRAELIDNTIIPIIGRKGEKSGEQVAKALQAAAQGNGARFTQFVKSLPAEEAGNVRASLIEGLGRAKSGAQNAEGDAFSFASFLTNWNNISKTARGALFEEGDRQAIERLARVSNQVKEAAKYANSSNTGNVVVNAGTGAYAIADPLGGFLGVAATWGLGKALAAPGVARVVAGMATSRSPGQAKDAMKRLTDIAAKNPAVAKEVLGLRDQIARGLNDNVSTVTRSAASDGTDPDRN